MPLGGDATTENRGAAQPPSWGARDRATYNNFYTAASSMQICASQRPGCGPLRARRPLSIRSECRASLPFRTRRGQATFGRPQALDGDRPAVHPEQDREQIPWVRLAAEVAEREELSLNARRSNRRKPWRPVQTCSPVGGRAARPSATCGPVRATGGRAMRLCQSPRRASCATAGW